MRHDNPGAWPDQGDSLYVAGRLPIPKLYTAAEMKAARVETVRKVAQIVAKVNYFPGADVWDEFVLKLDKLEEKIKNEL